MSIPKVIRLRLSLRGRPIRTFTFNQDLITIGRDAASDIVLDNPGVSRRHVSIARMPGGYFAARDMKSSNGTFVNGNRIDREYLTTQDQLRVGKYMLTVDYAEDRRQAVGAEDMLAPEPPLTTTLSRDELSRLMANKEQGLPGPELSLVTPEPELRQAWWKDAQTWVAWALGVVVGLALSRWL